MPARRVRWCSHRSTWQPARRTRRGQALREGVETYHRSAASGIENQVVSRSQSGQTRTRRRPRCNSAASSPASSCARCQARRQRKLRLLTLTVSTIGFLSKLLADDIEEIDSGQLEAARATG